MSVDVTTSVVHVKETRQPCELNNEISPRLSPSHSCGGEEKDGSWRELSTQFVLQNQYKWFIFLGLPDWLWRNCVYCKPSNPFCDSVTDSATKPLPPWTDKLGQKPSKIHWFHPETSGHKHMGIQVADGRRQRPESFQDCWIPAKFWLRHCLHAGSLDVQRLWKNEICLSLLNQVWKPQQCVLSRDPVRTLIIILK